MRQVFLSYGPLPNLRALLFYGFVLEDNPHDMLALTFEARPSCSHSLGCTSRASLTLSSVS